MNCYIINIYLITDMANSIEEFSDELDKAIAAARDALDISYDHTLTVEGRMAMLRSNLETLEEFVELVEYFSKNIVSYEQDQNEESFVESINLYILYYLEKVAKKEESFQVLHKKLRTILTVIRQLTTTRASCNE